MKLGGSLFIVFMLFASLGFAWITPPPSSFSSYTILGANFTYSTVSQPITFTTSTKEMYGWNASGQIFNTSTGFQIIGDDIYLWSFPLPVSGNHKFTTLSGSSDNRIQCIATGETVGTTSAGTFSLNTTNNITYNISFPGVGSMLCNNTGKIIINTGLSGSGVFTIDYYNATFTNEIVTPAYVVNVSDYMGIFNGKIARSDFTTGKISQITANSYCRSLLYFNNPYYGNIQLIPRMSYIPGTAAVPDFINTTDNSAYIPNNTISYIFDSITNAWYIVPATVCSSYSLVGSTSTLQYNPTGMTPGATGTIPININSISGSCSYVSTTRVITCTGSDTSNTLTSLNLTAFANGNSTLACSSGAVGSSATLTCTLPNVNGTYSAYFYGTDANNLNYLIAGNSYSVGTSSQTVFGRDGFLAAIILVVVAATLMTGSIAVSMVLGCFGLFLAVAVGMVPAETGAVAALFAVVALALAYRLKV
jgi:hypothetical protein